MNKFKKLPKNLINHKNTYLEPSLVSILPAIVEDQSVDFDDVNDDEGNAVSLFDFSAQSDYVQNEITSKNALIDEKEKDEFKIENHTEEQVHLNERISVKRNFWNRKEVDKVEILKESSKQEVRKGEKEMSINNSGETIKVSAVISSTMVVKGDVALDTSLVINGKVIGNINCNDLIEATFGSYIEGNIEAKSVKFNGSELKGNITVDDSFEANYQTKILGNIVAKRVEISGHVQGEIKASESLVLKNTAIVTGDLYSASISIEAGAQIEGKVVTIVGESKKSSKVEETEEELL